MQNPSRTVASKCPNRTLSMCGFRLVRISSLEKGKLIHKGLAKKSFVRFLRMFLLTNEGQDADDHENSLDKDAKKA